MPLSWNEIRANAARFSKEWSSETKEAAEYQTFWNDFFEAFGVRRRSVAVFQKNVAKLNGQPGFIDLFWQGRLICEHKSAGQSLDKAFDQAADYAVALKEEQRPRYIIVTDYARMRLCDLEPEPGQNDCVEFPLADLPAHVRSFGFIAGYEERKFRDEDPVNIKVAEAVGRLHDALEESGYRGRDLEVLLVRLVFCFFADDTNIFSPEQLATYLESRTAANGSDLGLHLAQIFQVLNQPLDQRQSTLDDELKAFPYVDGHVFEGSINLPVFSAKMREAVIGCTNFDWSAVSPAIFGSLFQAVMDPGQRHDLGAHYTSEKNILKVIGPLFLDELKEELEAANQNKTKLGALQDKMARMKFLDPACGCGNFLVVTYRELRLLELEILKRVFPNTLAISNVAAMSQVKVNKYYGIEIEGFAAKIAELAILLTDCQMNRLLSDYFGQYVPSTPFKEAPHITHGNALTTDWTTVVPKEELSYILGNPPFIGARVMDEAQKADMQAVFGKVTGVGELDYVSAWYMLAARYIQGTSINVAFVSTNSITQGEQVSILWGAFLKPFGLHINFAHRTFKWSNEAKGKAAVYCVIIGLGLADAKHKQLFDYEDVKGEPQVVEADNINAYLVDAPDVFVSARRKPLADVPEIGIGNKPIDGGNYLFSTVEKEEFLSKEPNAAPYFRKWYGAKEFLNGGDRWCLLLRDCPPEILRSMPEVMKRVEAVRNLRLQNPSADSQKMALKPTRFHVENLPDGDYLLIPRHSSENRRYIPIGFINDGAITGDSCMISAGAHLFHFGILTSEMHMAWVRQVCGRLKSDYRYSKDIVYNNFPWPTSATNDQIKTVETAAQAVLDARAKYPTSTLADLYDPRTMPADLLKAHQTLDKAVDTCYAYKSDKTERTRLRFLFEMYKTLVQ